MTFDYKAAGHAILERLDIRAEAESMGLRTAAASPSHAGWLACNALNRDDDTPSAAINVASDNGELGKYKDFGPGADERSISFWEFCVKAGRFADWREARAHYAQKTGIDLPNGSARPKAKTATGALADSVNWIDGAVGDAIVTQWATNKRGVTSEAAINAGGRAVRWPAKSRTPFECVAFPAYDGADRSEPIAIILYKADGKDFPATDSLPERKTHLVRGSRDGIVIVGSREHFAAAAVVVKNEGLTDALALSVQLPPDHIAVANVAGAKSFPPALAKVFTGKRAIVVHDADQAGEDGIRTVTSRLLNAAASTARARLPYDVAEKHGKDLRDFFNEGHTFDELLATVEECHGSANGKPRIDAGCQELSIITPQGWNALSAGNKPERLFLFGNRPVRIERGDQHEPILRPLDIDRLRHEAARSADWFATRGKDDAEFPAMPPLDVMRDMLATPQPPLPTLARIVEAPVFAPDGSLLTSPGYHTQARTYFAAAPGFTVPQVSDKPTAAEVAEAKSLLHDVICDFPFVGEADYAHTVALVLLPFARDLIEGATPLHLAEKSCPGTGATVLIDSCASIFVGRGIDTMTEGRDEDEWRKRITSKLRNSPAFLCIDNLRGRLDSAAVASALTAQKWADRILGSSEMITLPVRCVWVASGNNPAVSTEMARRTISIRLDAKMDRPWLRDGFKHPDLRAWVAANRGRLVWAALTIIRAWQAAGAKPAKANLGMYESWAATMGGILEFAGIPGFLGNLDRFYEEADEEGAGWRVFVALWWQRFSDREVKVSELYSIATSEADLNLGDGKEASQKARLGKLIAKNRDRMFTITPEGGEGGFSLRLSRAGAKSHSASWKLANVGLIGNANREGGGEVRESIPPIHYASAHSRTCAHAHANQAENLPDLPHPPHKLSSEEEAAVNDFLTS